MLKGPIMIIKASQNFWKSVSGCVEFREIPWSKWLRCQIAVNFSSSYHLFGLSVHLLIVFLAPYGMCHRACRGRIGNICFMLQTPNIHDLKHVCFSTQWLRLNHKLFICGKVHIAWLLQNRWIISQQSRAWWKWKLPSLVLTAAETGERYKFVSRGKRQ